jgi:hypothetical protein
MISKELVKTNTAEGLTFDAEAKRYWLLGGKRGLVTLQVSGDDPAQVRQVAAEALRQYAGQ